MDSGIEMIRLTVFRSSITPRLGQMVRLLLSLFFLYPLVGFSQEAASLVDTIRIKNETIQTYFSPEKLDSIRKVKLNGIDSLREQKLTIADSISESLRSQLDVSTKRLNSGIDSLGKLNLSTEVYAMKVDSLYKSFQFKTISKLRGKYDSLGLRADKRLSNLDSVLNLKSRRMDSLLVSRKLKGIGLSDKVDLENFNMNIPDFPNAPGLKNPVVGINPELNLPALTTPGIEGTNMLNLNSVNPAIPDVKGLEKMTEANEIIGEGTQYIDRTKGLSDEVKKAKEGEYNDELEDEVKKQAQNIDQVKEISKQSQSVDALNEKIKSVSVVATQKDDIREKGKKNLKDHFAGKDEVIKKDMEDIGKVQLKYRDVADSRNLPKRPPNEMKDKPFVERLIPAVSFQVVNGENVSVDFAPTIGYKFSGRIRSGIGMYRRVTYFEKERRIEIEDLIGIRLYNNIKLIRGFHSHVEFETFKNNEELVQGATTEDEKQWNYKLNLGFYNSYKLNKHFSGHIIVVYNVLKIKEFPGSSNGAIRFGFEYQITKRNKK